MEITKREVLFSIIIVVFMAIVGIFISSKIEDLNMKTNEDYYLAAKIEDQEQFQYGLKTSLGNALAYGEVTTSTPVSIKEISGEYFYIEKITERYNRHTKTQSYRDSKGKTRTRTVVYYSWDYYSSDVTESDTFNFMGKQFDNVIQNLPYERVDLLEVAVNNNNVHFNYIYNDSYFNEKVGDTREYYNIVPKSFVGTFELKLIDNKLQSFDEDSKLNFYANKTIDEVVESRESFNQIILIIFRVVWILLTGLVVVAFYYKENNWLE